MGTKIFFVRQATDIFMKYNTKISWDTSWGGEHRVHNYAQAVDLFADLDRFTVIFFIKAKTKTG